MPSIAHSRQYCPACENWGFLTWISRAVNTLPTGIFCLGVRATCLWFSDLKSIVRHNCYQYLEKLICSLKVVHRICHVITKIHQPFFAETLALWSSLELLVSDLSMNFLYQHANFGTFNNSYYLQITFSKISFCVILLACFIHKQTICFFMLQLLDLPGIIEGAKDGKGRGKQVIAGL